MIRSTPKASAASALLLVAIYGTIAFFNPLLLNNNSHGDDHSSPAAPGTADSSHLQYHLPPMSSSISSFAADVVDSANNQNGNLRLESSENHRRLSKALPDGGCELTWPVKPKPGIPITYAASYPGCGARMTWNLVEALTGLWTGDDWNNNGRGDEVVTVKTHYPQSNGILVDFDDMIHRAFIVIRNPMKSIPSFFNHIYEMRNHLPVHSERAPLDEWIKWRNAYVATEIAEYKKFIIYWMDRYSPENRLLMTYEGLTDDLIGAEVAKSLNEFLAQAEGVDGIAPESVGCVWRAVVKNQPPEAQAEQIKKLNQIALEEQLGKSGAPPPGTAEAAQLQTQQVPQMQQASMTQQLPQVNTGAVGGVNPLQQAYLANTVPQGLAQPGLRRRLDPGHHDSQRKGPEVPRPYEKEQLDDMMKMLLDVATLYQKKDVRLYHIMMGYYENIRTERLKLSPDEQITPPGGYY